MRRISGDFSECFSPARENEITELGRHIGSAPPLAKISRYSCAHNAERPARACGDLFKIIRGSKSSYPELPPMLSASNKNGSIAHTAIAADGAEASAIVGCAGFVDARPS